MTQVTMQEIRDELEACLGMERPDIDHALDLIRQYGEPQWLPIETAPKDGSVIWLLSKAEEPDQDNGDVSAPAKCHAGYWNPEGDSWVDEYGRSGGEAHHLAVTGTWFSGIGWFEPGEVTHWMPLPATPKEE